MQGLLFSSYTTATSELISRKAVQKRMFGGRYRGFKHVHARQGLYYCATSPAPHWILDKSSIAKSHLNLRQFSIICSWFIFSLYVCEVGVAKPHATCGSLDSLQESVLSFCVWGQGSSLGSQLGGRHLYLLRHPTSS